MFVCVSGVSAGVSIVLIKYIGNVWLQLCMYGVIGLPKVVDFYFDRI